MGFCSIFGNSRDATPLYEIMKIFQKPAAYKAHNSSSIINLKTSKKDNKRPVKDDIKIT